MPITAESLPLRRPDTYPRDMAREATNLEIAALRTEASPEALMTRTGSRTAVPELFTAYFSLARPPLDVRMIVRVPRGGVAQIKHLEMDSSRGEPTITSGHLRGVALDKLLREALKSAEVTVIPRDEINPDAFRLEGDDQTTFRIQRPVESRTERRRLDLAARAAKVYLKAVEEGSRAPAEAVAAALNRSRSQAAVYIRIAREEGWIPARGDVQGDVPASAADPKWSLTGAGQLIDEDHPEKSGIWSTWEGTDEAGNPQRATMRVWETTEGAPPLTPRDSPIKFSNSEEEEADRGRREPDQDED